MRSRPCGDGLHSRIEWAHEWTPPAELSVTFISCKAISRTPDLSHGKDIREPLPAEPFIQSHLRVPLMLGQSSWMLLFPGRTTANLNVLGTTRLQLLERAKMSTQALELSFIGFERRWETNEGASLTR